MRDVEVTDITAAVVTKGSLIFLISRSIRLIMLLLAALL